MRPPRARPPRTLPLLLPVLVLAALVGCGGDGGGGEAGAEGRIVAKVIEKEQPGIPADAGQWMLEIETDPDGERAYTVKEAVAPQGNTNLELKNPQSTRHDLTIEQVGDGSVATEVVREGSAWVRISLFEGERYVFYCSIPGHRKAGMEGVLKVDPQLETEDLEVY